MATIVLSISNLILQKTNYTVYFKKDLELVIQAA